MDYSEDSLLETVDETVPIANDTATFSGMDNNNSFWDNINIIKFYISLDEDKLTVTDVHDDVLCLLNVKQIDKYFNPSKIKEAI